MGKKPDGVAGEAANLARLFESVANRAQFARDHNIPVGQAVIYQHITGHRPVSLEAAIAYAEGFRCSLKEISPRWAALVAKGNKYLEPHFQLATDEAGKPLKVAEPPGATPIQEQATADLWKHYQAAPAAARLVAEVALGRVTGKDVGEDVRDAVNLAIKLAGKAGFPASPSSNKRKAASVS